MSIDVGVAAAPDELLERLVPVPEGELEAGRPEIVCVDRALDAITDDALAAVELSNDPPTLFQRGTTLVRVRAAGAGGTPLIEPMGPDALRGHLARIATWRGARYGRAGGALAHVPPPLETVRDLLALPGWPQAAIPPLEGVVECPTFARDGTLVATPGYHPAAAVVYRPAPGLIVPEVPEQPSPESVQGALQLLLGDLMGDFPFKDEASRTNALALLLLPFVRSLIDGPTPLHLIDAAKPGTGKGLLVDAVHVVAAGRCAEPMPEADDDAEWRKRVFAALLGDPKFLFIDNVNTYVDSGALASALTARTMKDRMMGASRTAEVPVRCVWVAAGNNVRMSEELARRTPLIRMVAPVEEPWTRPPSDFQHPDLIAWAAAHRGPLIGAALTLCRAWMAAGRPDGSVAVGSYEPWARVMGGIMGSIGRPDFMANAAEMTAHASDDATKWRAFVERWWAVFGGDVVGAPVLFPLIEAEGFQEGVLGDGNELSRRSKLGRALSRRRDASFGGLRVLAAGTAGNGGALYRLEPLAVG
ncbi:hypothetical protein [Paludisphaera soli]|uniref:hypothetical protein n=1 Tax=Paludisphaera soli TaxID=2712865 RepID=UPI0013EC017D|nr:hypothetical protein [Paludisphaera soli]